MVGHAHTCMWSTNNAHHMRSTPCRENTACGQHRGELPEELAAQYEQQRKSLDALTKSLTTIADVTGASLPVLQDAATRMTGSGGQAIVRQLVCEVTSHVAYCLASQQCVHDSRACMHTRW